MALLQYCFVNVLFYVKEIMNKCFVVECILHTLLCIKEGISYHQYEQLLCYKCGMFEILQQMYKICIELCINITEHIVQQCDLDKINVLSCKPNEANQLKC